MKTVHICGLYRADMKGYRQSDLEAGGAEVWTVNDFYRCYEWMRPHRVFNVHFAPHITEGDESRFPGDWRGEYNDVIREGGKISVVEIIKRVDAEGQELLPKALWDVFPRCAIGCSISVAICLAAYQGFERIELRGIRLRDTEYADQLSFVLNAILHAKAYGVREIINPYEAAWDRAEPLTGIDWENAQSVNVGSLKHLLAYSMDLTLSPETLQLTQQDLTP